MGEEFRRIVEDQRASQLIDDQLVTALFAPALRADPTAFIGYERCKDPACTDRGYELLQALLPLFEFYQQHNPPLSTAIWGIWNSLSHIRNQRSLFAIFGESKKSKEAFFVDLRALVAFAAVQFADGTPSLAVTSKLNPTSYRQHAERAMRELSKIPTV